MPSRLRVAWERLAGRYGVALCLAGFGAIWLGWNGAASTDRVASQIPYLVSGGLGGLGLILVGAALMVAEAGRRHTAELLEALRSTSRPAETPPPSPPSGNGHGGLVVVGSASYHRPDCRVVRARTALPTMTAAEAEATGRTACRVCEPG